MLTLGRVQIAASLVLPTRIYIYTRTNNVAFKIYWTVSIELYAFLCCRRRATKAQPNTHTHTWMQIWCSPSVPRPLCIYSLVGVFVGRKKGIYIFLLSKGFCDFNFFLWFFQSFLFSPSLWLIFSYCGMYISKFMFVCICIVRYLAFFRLNFLWKVLF